MPKQKDVFDVAAKCVILGQQMSLGEPCLAWELQQATGLTLRTVSYLLREPMQREGSVEKIASPDFSGLWFWQLTPEGAAKYQPHLALVGG